jgi:hypothetical protein
MTDNNSLGSAEVRIHARSNSYEHSRAAEQRVTALQCFDRCHEAARNC